MFDELLELGTTLVDSGHEPNLQHFGEPSSSPKTMARQRHTKSQSISSNANDTAAPVAKPPASTRRPRQSTASAPSSPVVAIQPLPAAYSRLPSTFQYPLVVLLSYALNATLYSLIAGFSLGDLAGVSKHTESWAEVAGLLIWKAVELGIYWFGNFDAYDVASVSLLLSTPHTVLLSLFFNIRPTTLALTTLTTVISTTTPFWLLRKLSPPHHASTAAKGTVRNRAIITDLWTTVSTSLLATAIFATLLELSFATFLPTWLILHFEHIRDLSAAHLGASGLPELLLSLIPAGFACTLFLFISSTAAPATPAYVFDTETSGLLAHVYHNTWGWYSNRQKELISRTLLLMGMILVETVIHSWGTVEGVELTGALGYAGIWSAGVGVVGAVLDWVGAPSG